MTSEEIRRELFANKDEEYREFQAKLMPGIDIERIIGVRTPILRKIAKSVCKEKDTDDFLHSLPHAYYDENNLHGFIISEIRDYDEAIKMVDEILPYVDNWATCDLLSPKAFKKNKTALKEDIKRWISSGKTYTVRFGIEMIMSHFLDEDFEPGFLGLVSEVQSDEYYVNMMIAWFFATALAKQWDSTAHYIIENRLDEWTHNKTIRKAVESYRITDEQKNYLKGLKR